MTPTEYFVQEYGYYPEDDIELGLELDAWLEQIPDDRKVEEMADEEEIKDFDPWDFFV